MIICVDTRILEVSADVYGRINYISENLHIATQKMLIFLYFSYIMKYEVNDLKL